MSSQDEASNDSIKEAQLPLSKSSTSNTSSNVRVAVRVRPLTPKELLSGSHSCIQTVSTSQLLIGSKRSFAYDFVFDETTNQETIYTKCVKELVEGVFEGYNSCVFAYGKYLYISLTKF